MTDQPSTEGLVNRERAGDALLGEREQTRQTHKLMAWIDMAGQSS